MNFTRIVGQNNQIYRKYGDYCISEANEECFIICGICQKEHQCEVDFWAHINEEHHIVQSYKVFSGEQQQNHQSEANKMQEKDKECAAEYLSRECQRVKEASPSPNARYAKAEYLEGVELNEPYDYMREEEQELNNVPNLRTERRRNEQETSEELNAQEQTYDDEGSAKENYSSTTSTTSSLPNDVAGHRKQFNIEKISSKYLHNEKVLKKIFVQMQSVDNELNEKLQRLEKQVQMLEQILKRNPKYTRRQTMQVIPQQPFTTRDEVHILDEELNHSKEMRECLKNEALLVMADSVEGYCRSLWRMLMNDEVSEQFCWRGAMIGDKVAKYPIKNLTLMAVLQEAFQVKFPAQPANYFKERTMNYFGKARSRLKRQKQQKEQQDRHKNCIIARTDDVKEAAAAADDDDDKTVLDEFISKRIKCVSDGNSVYEHTQITDYVQYYNDVNDVDEMMQELTNVEMFES